MTTETQVSADNLSVDNIQHEVRANIQGHPEILVPDPLGLCSVHANENPRVEVS